MGRFSLKVESLDPSVHKRSKMYGLHMFPSTEPKLLVIKNYNFMGRLSVLQAYTYLLINRIVEMTSHAFI